MSRKERRTARPSVAIEVTQTRLNLTVLEVVAGNRLHVRSRSVEWRQDCKSLHSELGCREITAAMSKLANQEKLANLPICLTLNSDYCVTRVVTGGSEFVRQELEALEERTGLYLRLGYGAKATARTVVPLDARHHHALVTVTNEHTLQALNRAAEAARLNIERIEASTVALCRCVASGGHDADAPILVVNLGEREVGLSVSYRGRLLLEYRPGGGDAHGEVRQIVASHLRRLERYCGRVCGNYGMHIQKVFVVGRHQEATAACSLLAENTDLVVEMMLPAHASRPVRNDAAEQHTHSTVVTQGAVDVQLECDDSANSAEVCSALGTCLIGALPEGQQPGPNLMETVRAAHQERLARLVVKAFWPAAAALLVVAGILGLVAIERLKNSSLRAEIDALAPARHSVAALERELMSSKSMVHHLTVLQGQLRYAKQDKLLELLARHMPDDVWLDRIEIDSAGHATLKGTSFGDEGVFEFVRWLSDAPGVTRVQLEGTTAAQLATAACTKFEVKFDVIQDSTVKGGVNSTNESDS